MGKDVTIGVAPMKAAQGSKEKRIPVTEPIICPRCGHGRKGEGQLVVHRDDIYQFWVACANCGHFIMELSKVKVATGE